MQMGASNKRNLSKIQLSNEFINISNRIIHCVGFMLETRAF